MAMGKSKERIEARLAALRVNHIENEKLIKKWVRIARKWNKENPDNEVSI